MFCLHLKNDPAEYLYQDLVLLRYLVQEEKYLSLENVKKELLKNIITSLLPTTPLVMTEISEKPFG